MNRKIKIHLLLVVVFLIVVSAFGQERYVPRIDEADSNPSFSAFRKNLIAATRKKDVAFIYSMLDPKIKNSFGGDDGISNFKKGWNYLSPNSDFWKQFLFVITHGGKFQDSGIFAAPDIFAAFPEDLDSFEYQVIAGDNVRLRAAPNTNSEVKELLSYNIVKVDYGKSVSKRDDVAQFVWLWIETLGGKTGYVSADFVRSPIDYRAGFQKKAGKWKMIFFVAGD